MASLDGAVRDVVTYQLTGPRQFSRQPQPLPPLRSGWARVEFLYCGICGSDLSYFEGRRRIDYPRSMGHEFVARIVDLGEGTVGLQPDDIVTSDLNFRCGDCRQCRSGRSHLCEKGRQGAFTNRAFGRSADLDASYLSVVPSKIAHPHFALIEPLSCVLHGLDWLGLDTRSDTLIVGGGGLGLCAAFALDSCFDGGTFEMIERIAGRCERLTGAMHKGKVVAAASRTYDTVLDLSGTRSGLGIALDRVANGGRLCTLSHLDGSETPHFLHARLQRRDISFKLSYLNGSGSTVGKAASYLASNWAPRWNDCLDVSPLAEIQQVFERRAASSANKDILEIGAAALADQP
jgi:threonine dehydrogenase-like Zn-dependent dehydrogenase